MRQRTRVSSLISEQRDRDEAAYVQRGINRQRLFPNEEFVRFMGRHFFPIPWKARSRISILEVGCGTGGNLWMLAKQGFDAHGIDFSPTAVALCKQTMERWDTEFQCSVGNMLDLAFIDGTFDAVADVFSATHLPYSAHGDLYREAYRVLKPGGRFFSYHASDQCDCYQRGACDTYEEFTVCDIIDPSAPYRGNGLMCFLPLAQCRAMLEVAGFVDVIIERIGRTYRNGEEYFEFLSVDARKT